MESSQWLESWENQCRLYDRNRIGIGWQTSVKMKDGSPSISLSGFGEYAGAAQKIKQLALANCENALKWLSHFLTPVISQIRDVAELVGELLYTLLCDGFDAFIEKSNNVFSVYRLKRDLSVISLKDGVWSLDGAVWNGICFEKDGEYIINSDCPVWQEILSDQAQQNIKKLEKEIDNISFKSGDWTLNDASWNKIEGGFLLNGNPVNAMPVWDLIL